LEELGNPWGANLFNPGESIRGPAGINSGKKGGGTTDLSARE